MATKYQIFVSSTYEDLKAERDRVIQGILEMGHIPVGMEMFSAADEAQWQIIARHIEESDYYVIIVAHRYGSMDGTVSYTRKEYEYAIACEVPVIGFIIDPTASWPADRFETDAAMRERLAYFKQLVANKPVGFWTNADDLYGKAGVALFKAINAQPRTGWVRATSALGPEVTAEISRLSAENATLRADLSAMRTQRERDAAAELTELWATMSGKDWKYSVRFVKDGDWEDAAPISYAELFMILAPNMVAEATAEFLADLLLVNSKRPGSHDDEHPLAIPINQRNSLLADFVMLGLMEPSQRRHPVADKADYWCLNNLGQQLLNARRRRRFDGSPDEEDSGGDAA